MPLGTSQDGSEAARRWLIGIVIPAASIDASPTARHPPFVAFIHCRICVSAAFLSGSSAGRLRARPRRRVAATGFLSDRGRMPASDISASVGEGILVQPVTTHAAVRSSRFAVSTYVADWG